MTRVLVAHVAHVALPGRDNPSDHPITTRLHDPCESKPQHNHHQPRCDGARLL